jgi:hypothetical protein
MLWGSLHVIPIAAETAGRLPRAAVQSTGMIAFTDRLDTTLTLAMGHTDVGVRRFEKGGSALPAAPRVRSAYAIGPSPRHQPAPRIRR